LLSIQYISDTICLYTVELRRPKLMLFSFFDTLILRGWSQRHKKWIIRFKFPMISVFENITRSVTDLYCESSVRKQMRWSLRTTGFFGLRPSSRIRNNWNYATFRKLDLFPSSGVGMDAATLLVPWKEFTSISPVQWLLYPRGATFPSPEDGNRPSFRNVAFSSYLQFLTIYEVQKPVILGVMNHRKNSLVFQLRLCSLVHMSRV
jgi:hypothetical protein